MDMQTVQQQIDGNYARVKDRIAEAAGRRGADPATVKLICITKYARIEWVTALLAAGATDLGENLLPRAVERFDALAADGGVFRRHLVGPIQSRKAKLVPGKIDLVQALDRLKIADMLSALNSAAGLRQDVLLQVNIGGQEQKHGVEPEAAAEAAEYIRSECKGIELRGMMAVPPEPAEYEDDTGYERETRRYFAQMKALFDRIQPGDPATSRFDTLSLGMSRDFTWAIEEGATMVRVGSALYEGLS